MIEALICWKKNGLGIRIYKDESLSVSIRIPIQNNENKDNVRLELLGLKYVLLAIKPTDELIKIYAGQFSKMALFTELKSQKNVKLVNEIKQLADGIKNIQHYFISVHRDVEIMKILADINQELPVNSTVV